VIADIFEKGDVATFESELEQRFRIVGKENITLNVKHALNLDKTRVEKIISGFYDNRFIKQIMRNFLASAEKSETFEQLGVSKDYLCYTLK
jgi:hypothetical protein